MADSSNSAAAADVAPTPSGAQPDPLIGRTVNERFKILSVIARGGMGKVYKAEQAPLGRICAVKVLNPNYNGENDPEFHKRFFLEASIASKLSHPNTVTIFDYGRTSDDVYYMAMEYLEGSTLHRVIRTEGPLPAHRVVHIARQMCRSLREAHGLGVIHRDLKPANIYIIQQGDEQDFVKVLDFGLVKSVDDKSESLTQAGLFMGSPKYMAPEQIRGDHCGPTADVYALGVVMFEMLTAKVPFDGGTSVNTLMMHVNDPIPNMRVVAPNAAIPEALEDVVYRCMQKRPEDRFQTMDELLAALKRANGEPGGMDYAASMLVRSGEMQLAAGASGDPSLNSDSGLVIPSHVPPPEPTREERVIPAVPATETRSGSGKGIALLLVGVLLVAGIGAGIYLSRATATSPPVARPANHVDPAPTATPTAPTEPPAPHVHVALLSEPAGAEVLEGDRSLGHTPLTLDWTGSDGDPTRSHTFTFRLAGRQDATTTLTGDSLEHTAVLEPVVAAVTANAADAGAGAGGATTRPRVRTNRPHPGGNGTPHGYRGIDDW